MSAFIEEHRQRFGVEPICSTLEVSASAYCERRSGRGSARAVEDERLLARIKEVHEANYCAYGYRRTWIALRRAGEEVGRGRVQRPMRQAGRGRAEVALGQVGPAGSLRIGRCGAPGLATALGALDPPNRLWVGDAYDNAMAESFVDTFKTELVADRSSRSRSQLGLAVVEYVSRFNHERLHESLGDISPLLSEDLYVRQEAQLSNLS